MSRQPQPSIRRLAETERYEPGLRIVRPWSEILGAWQARRLVPPPPPPSRLPMPYPASAPLRLAVTLGLAAAFVAVAAIAYATEAPSSAPPPLTPLHAPAPPTAPHEPCRPYVPAATETTPEALPHSAG